MFPFRGSLLRRFVRGSTPGPLAHIQPFTATRGASPSAPRRVSSPPEAASSQGHLSVPPAAPHSPTTHQPALVGLGPSSGPRRGRTVVVRAVVDPTCSGTTTGQAEDAASGDGSVATIITPAPARGTTQAGPEPEPAVRQAWHRPDVAVVLVHPQIPQNTGNVARTCAATAAPLHLVAPLGFQLDDRKLKRAGLDYWDAVAVNTHASWAAFFRFFRQLPGPKRLVAFTVYGETYYGAPEFRYQPGDWLVFGAETSGLPPEAHEDVVAAGGCLVKIPIRDTHVRSINLSVAVGVGLFEAVRQLDVGTEGHIVTARQSPTLHEVAAAHRDGKPLGPKAGSPDTPPLL